MAAPSDVTLVWRPKACYGSNAMIDIKNYTECAINR